jgi:hypothetical protein
MSDAGFTKAMSQTECREWLDRARQVEGFAEHSDAKWVWKIQQECAEIPQLEHRRIENPLAITLNRPATWAEFEECFWPLANPTQADVHVGYKVQQSRTKKRASPDHADLVLRVNSFRQTVDLSVFNQRALGDQSALLRLMRRAIVLMGCDQDVQLTDEGRVRIVSNRFVDAHETPTYQPSLWNRLLNFLDKLREKQPSRPCVGYSPMIGGPINSLYLRDLPPSETLKIGNALIEGLSSEGDSYAECSARLPLSELNKGRARLASLVGPWKIEFSESGTESLDELLKLPASSVNQSFQRSAFSIENPDVGLVAADLSFDGKAYSFHFTQRDTEEEHTRGWRRLRQQLSSG